MSKSIYKYVGSSYLNHVLGLTNNVTLKCSYPKVFNDPYELFLTVDFSDDPEALAFYAEVIGDLPQISTTCFSRSPVVIPMWAHYAEDLQGFAIEFDEVTMAEAFPESGFGDVDYQDEPDSNLNQLLRYACESKKPRHVYQLRREVLSAAYYTKTTCWDYEQERRMLIREHETRQDGDLVLIDVSAECVTALLCGPQASTKTVHAVREKATQLGCRYYDLKVGKSSAVPFFVDLGGYSFTFDGSAIRESEFSCSSCGEVLANDADLCSWCQITEAHASEAAQSNPYRMLANLGMLDSYVQEMDEIDRRTPET